MPKNDLTNDAQTPDPEFPNIETGAGDGNFEGVNRDTPPEGGPRNMDEMPTDVKLNTPSTAGGDKVAQMDQAHIDRLKAQYGDDPHIIAAVQNALAQTGTYPTTIDHRGPTPEQAGHDVVFPERPAPAPRGFWSQASYYIIAERDIMASTVGMAVAGITMDASTVTADVNGDKIVYEGTVLKATGGAKGTPRTTGTAVGVLLRRVNLRDGDVDVGIVVGGWVRSDKCWDNAVFGSVASSVKTDLPAIQFVTTDI